MPSDRVIAGGLFALALAIRLVHFVTILNASLFSRLALDPLAYDEWGRRIAAGAWLGDRIFYQDPLYPYFLGVVYSVFGHSYAAAILVQVVLGALLPVLGYSAARPWLGRGAALAGAVLAALYAPAIYYEGLILKSWMEAFFLAAGLWTLSLALRSERLRWWTGTGVLLGLGCLVRANFLLLIPLLAAWGALSPPAAPSPGAARARRWRPAGALLAGAACVLLLCAFRNRAVGGEWVLTTAQMGQNFYLGNNAGNRSGEYEALAFVSANPKHEEHDFAVEAERRLGRSLRPTEVSRYWFRQGLAWMRDHPADWLRLMWKKTRVFWSAYEVPDNLDYYLYQTEAPVLRLPLPGFGWVVPLAIVGVFFAARIAGWPRAVLAVLFVYSSSVILFYVFARYRLGMMPACFPLAGAAIVGLGRAAHGLRDGAGRGRFAALATATLAAFAVVNLPVRAPQDYWTFRWARAIGLPVQAATTSMAHFNLGVTYAKEAKEAADPADLLRKAESELREALRQDREHAQIYVELGKVLARQRRDDEAIESYEAAARIAPGDWRTYHALGILFRRAGRVQDATRAFETASRLEPRQGDSATSLGELFLEQRRFPEAAEAFRSALRVSPNNESARRGLEAAEK